MAQPHEGSYATGGEKPLDVQSIFVLVLPSFAKVVEEIKDRIISSVRRAMAKQKVVMAKDESSVDVGVTNVERRVQLWRGLACLLTLISSILEGVVAIPDDNVHHSKGNQGVLKQPIVSMKVVSRPTLIPSSLERGLCVCMGGGGCSP